MSKKYCFIFVCVMLISHSVFSETSDELGDFEKYIEQHKIQMDWGGGLSISGVVLSVVGGVLASYALSIDDENNNPYRKELVITGYSVMGVSALFVLVGIPLWFLGNKDYLETLDLRQQYYFLSRE